MRAAYTQYLADAAQDRLVAPLARLSQLPGDEDMSGLEEQARGLRRLLLEIRGIGGAAVETTALQKVVLAARDCAALPPIDRARLAECLGYSEAATKLLEG